jgi:hypothetical protein
MLELFSTSRLADETGLRAALCHLNALGGHSELQSAIEHLLSLPHVFAQGSFWVLMLGWFLLGDPLCFPTMLWVVGLPPLA